MKLTMPALSAACALSLSFVAGSAALAQDSLPTVKEVFDRYIEVTGGREAHEKITNRVSSGSIEIPLQAVKGTATLTQAAPNKMTMRVEFPGIGMKAAGCDGENAWVWDTMTGGRLLEGPERASQLQQAAFNPQLHWDKIYKSVRLVGEGETDAGPAYKIELEMDDGQKLTRYFDKATGLLVMEETVAKMQMGEVPVVSIVSDYREADGVRLPFRSVQTLMGMQIVTTFDSIKHNVELAPDAFDPPDEVKQLIAEKNKPAEPNEAPADAPPKP